ncbi:MAG: DUF1800 family protein [Bacteroidota bacterium]
MASIDPRTGPLGVRLAKHLLRRATYNVTQDRINYFATLTAQQALAELNVVPSPSIPEPLDPETGDYWINQGSDPSSGDFALKQYVKGWWLDQARQDPGIGHKMMFFLHANFVVHSNTLTSQYNFDYYQLLRHYALGDFKALTVKMSIDNMMLDYLDGRYSNKYNPNENYAREFLELFTIGKGDQAGPDDYTNYTEQDVQEGAKLFTGWRLGDRIAEYIDPDTGLYQGYADPNRHDTTNKQFSHRFQNQVVTGRSDAAGMLQEIEDYCDIVLGQAETAKFICRKLYRYFVSSHITTEIETDIIVPMANTFRANYNLGAAVTQLLTSKHFYGENADGSSSEKVMGGLLKNPMELVLQTLNYFNVPIPDPVTQTDDHYRNFYRIGLLYDMFEVAGFLLYEPTSVAGYEPYYQSPGFNRGWFSSSSIIARYKVPETLLTGEREFWGGSLGTQLDFVQWVDDNISTPVDPQILIDELLDNLFVEVPGTERKAYYLNTVLLDGVPMGEWSTAWATYQGGDRSAVEGPLNRLFTSIIYSQEYQLS